MLVKILLVGSTIQIEEILFLKHESPAAPLSVTQIPLHGNIEYEEVQTTSMP